MKLIGLLPWYEESPAMLAAAVASLARCCDHLVAVDGAYFLYPGAVDRPCSGAEQAEAILETAHGAGLPVTVHVPRSPWYGNEVEKRTFMLRLAATLAEPMVDWYLSVDADMVVSYVGALKERLQATGLDVATYSLFWRDDRHCTEQRTELERRYAARAGQNQVRSLFRALPRLRVEGAHYVYVGDRDGRPVYLWGNPRVHELAPELDLTGELKIEHRHAFRDRARQLDAAAYYERRDTHGAERLVRVVTETVDGRLAAVT